MSIADELSKLKELHEQGALSAAEYDAAKKKILAEQTSTSSLSGQPIKVGGASHSLSSQPIKVGGGASSQPSKNTKKTSTPSGGKLLVAIIGGLILVSLGWFGAFIGALIVLWGIISNNTNKRSLANYIAGAPQSRLMNILTIVIGGAIFFASIGVAYSRHQDEVEAAQKKQMEAEKAAAEQKALDEKKKKTEAEFPEKLKKWKLALLDAEEVLQESKKFDRGQMQSVKNVFAQMDSDLRLVDIDKFPNATATISLLKSVDAKYEQVDSFLNLIDAIQTNFKSGESKLEQEAWLEADSSFQEALDSVEKVNKSDKWLLNYVPSDVNLKELSAKIRGSRNKIEPLVKKARKEIEIQERAEILSSIESSLNSNDRSSYFYAKTKLQNLKESCGGCESKRKIAQLLRTVEKELDDWPLEISSLQEIKNRYADLRGRKVKTTGSLSVSTYYNCRFRSQSRWRSFTLGNVFTGAIHVYCARGDDVCDNIHNDLAGGGSLSITATIMYPSHNNVCEEDQAQLLAVSR